MVSLSPLPEMCSAHDTGIPSPLQCERNQICPTPFHSPSPSLKRSCKSRACHDYEHTCPAMRATSLLRKRYSLEKSMFLLHHGMPMDRCNSDTKMTCPGTLHTAWRLLLLQAWPATAKCRTSGRCKTENQSKQMPPISVISFESVITSEVLVLSRVVHRMTMRIWSIDIFPSWKTLLYGHCSVPSRSALAQETSGRLGTNGRPIPILSYQAISQRCLKW